MTKWQQHRQVLLAIAFAGVFLTLGRFSLDPSAGNRSVTPLAFPSAIPLLGWQLLESRPLTKSISSPPQKLSEAVLSSQKYRYQQNHQQIEVEMRYLVSTSGELQNYFSTYTSIQLRDGQLLQNLRQQAGIGFYSLFVHEGRSHLSACINPDGSSTVTSKQFLSNQYTDNFQLKYLLAWLLGKSSLPDKRCLWVDLSIPVNDSAATTYPVLEQVWLSWYQWWSSRFPEY